MVNRVIDQRNIGQKVNIAFKDSIHEGVIVGEGDFAQYGIVDASALIMRGAGDTVFRFSQSCDEEPRLRRSDKHTGEKPVYTFRSLGMVHPGQRDYMRYRETLSVYGLWEINDS